MTDPTSDAWRPLPGDRYVKPSAQTQPRIVRYDAETIDYVAWELAKADGFRYGRCASIGAYIEKVRDIVTALERAAELQDAGEFA